MAMVRCETDIQLYLYYYSNNLAEIFAIAVYIRHRTLFLLHILVFIKILYSLLMAMCFCTGCFTNYSIVEHFTRLMYLAPTNCTSLAHFFFTLNERLTNPAFP